MSLTDDVFGLLAFSNVLPGFARASFSHLLRLAHFANRISETEMYEEKDREIRSTTITIFLLFRHYCCVKFTLRTYVSNLCNEYISPFLSFLLVIV